MSAIFSGGYLWLFVLQHSCKDIYAHSCLKPFSVGQKLCSNSKTHVQIIKFTCRLNNGFWPWSMQRDITVFRGNKMADVEEAPRLPKSFDLVNIEIYFKKFYA